MKRKRRQPTVKPEVAAFLENEGPKLLMAFFKRYLNGKKSMRGNHYETD